MKELLTVILILHIWCIDYRRKGIAFKVLDMLVKECRERNITAISLEATAMGRPLYEKYGFVKMEHEMKLP